MKEQFSGTVKGGKLVIDQPLRWTGTLAGQEGNRLTVIVEREVARRSNEHNARYWAVLVPLAGHLLSRTRDVPLSKKQIHFVLASAFGGTVETPLGLVPVETHLFTTDQFHNYCTSIEAWLAEAGYSIPEPGELVEASL